MQHRMIKHLEKIWPIIIGVAIYILLHPLSVSNGLPSYERGVFHSATIGYYLETARLLVEDGWWTSKTCLGFQDIIRFYPPLSIFMLYIVLVLHGTPETAVLVGMTIAVSVLIYGLYLYLKIIIKNKLLSSIIAPLAIIAVPGYAGTIAIYWEYTRIMGDGLAFISLALLEKGMQKGDEKSIMSASVLLSLTILTSLISAQWLVLMWAIIFLREITMAYKTYLGESVIELFRLAWKSILIVITITGWWIVPAILPWGLSHYTRVNVPLSEKINILTSSLSLSLDIYDPALGIIPIIISVIGLLKLKRKNNTVTWLYIGALSILIYSLLYGQGHRLIPILGIMVVIAGISSIITSLSRVALVLSLVVLLVGVSMTYPIYNNKFHLDYSYRDSDEYKLARWLANINPDGYVYIMYGPRLHGNQWIHVFNPSVKLVLSHYMEGCLNKKSFQIDWYIKETLNLNKTYDLLKENNVVIVVVDKEWNKNHFTVIDLMTENNVIVPASINRYLNYSEAYYVKDVNTGFKEIKATYWTISRFLGAFISFLGFYYFWKKYKYLS